MQAAGVTIATNACSLVHCTGSTPGLVHNKQRSHDNCFIAPATAGPKQEQQEQDERYDSRNIREYKQVGGCRKLLH